MPSLDAPQPHDSWPVHLPLGPILPQLVDQVRIRAILNRDVPDLAAIDRRCFDRPWSETEFRRLISRRYPHVHGRLVDFDGLVSGYIFWESQADHLRILNIAVDPNVRRIGVGRCLGNYLVDQLRPDLPNRIIVDVWERNLEAQLFFRSLGFRWVETVVGTYPSDPDEPAYRMRYSVHPQTRNRPLPVRA